jgi:hypothetical protein
MGASERNIQYRLLFSTLHFVSLALRAQVTFVPTPSPGSTPFVVKKEKTAMCVAILMTTSYMTPALRCITKTKKGLLFKFGNGQEEQVGAGSRVAVNELIDENIKENKPRELTFKNWKVFTSKTISEAQKDSLLPVPSIASMIAINLRSWRIEPVKEGFCLTLGMFVIS